MPDDKSLEERFEDDQTYAGMVRVLEQNTGRTLTPKEITDFLKRKEVLYFKLKNQGEKELTSTHHPQTHLPLTIQI